MAPSIIWNPKHDYERNQELILADIFLYSLTLIFTGYGPALCIFLLTTSWTCRDGRYDMCCPAASIWRFTAQNGHFIIFIPFTFVHWFIKIFNQRTSNFPISLSLNEDSDYRRILGKNFNFFDNLNIKWVDFDNCSTTLLKRSQFQKDLFRK